MAVTLVLLFLVLVTVWPASFALHSARPSTAIAILKARDGVSTSSNPHSALITPPPQVQDQALSKRDSVSTCGYVSGDPASPLTCPKSYACISTVQFLVGWACCNDIQCVGNYYTCKNYGEQLCEGLDEHICSSVYTSILSCSSANPSCFSYARSSSLGASGTQYSLGCGKSSGEVLALITTTGGRGGQGEQVEATATGVSSSSISSDGTTPGGTQPSSKSSGDSSNGWSQGIIAGVTVAAIAAVVAIVVAWWKKHQVLWLITCGCFGERHSDRRTRPPSQPRQGFNLHNVNQWHSQPPPPPPLNNFTHNINSPNQQLRNGLYQNGQANHGPVYY